MSSQVGIYGEVASANIDTSNGEERCDAEMKDDDTLSEIFDKGSHIVGDVYMLQEINDFLDMTFGKTVDVRNFFDDEKFIASVLLLQKTINYEALDKKKRFR